MKKTSVEKFKAKNENQGPMYKYGVSGQKYFWGPSNRKPRIVVDWLEHSSKLVGSVRFNGFMFIQQFTINIACIVGTVYIFNRNYNFKTK